MDGECNYEGDTCPNPAQTCTWAPEYALWMCLPELCDNDSACSGNERCQHYPPADVKMCLPEGFPSPGMACSAGQDQQLRCVADSSDFVACTDGVWQLAGSCELGASCDNRWGDWSVVCDEDDELSHFAILGGGCAFSDPVASCVPDRSEVLLCENYQWVQWDVCPNRSYCRQIRHDEPGCGEDNDGEGCVGCAY